MEIAVLKGNEKMPKNMSKEAILNKKATSMLLKFIYKEIVNLDIEEDEKLRLTESMLISCSLSAFHNNKAMQIMKEMVNRNHEKKEDAKYHINQIINSYIDSLALALTTLYVEESCVKH